MSLVATRLAVLDQHVDQLSAANEETPFSVWFKSAVKQYHWEMAESARTHSNKLVTCWAEIMDAAGVKAFTPLEKQQLRDVKAADFQFKQSLKEVGL